MPDVAITGALKPTLVMTGKVARLYVRKDITNIRLDNAPASGPKENYFRLQMDRPNYNALYALVLAAAANGWPLSVKILGSDGISAERDAFVDYLVVDWQASGDQTRVHVRDHRRQ